MKSIYDDYDLQGQELALSEFSKSDNLVLNNRRFIYDVVISLKFFGKFFEFFDAIIFVTSRDIMRHYVTLLPRYDIVLFDTYCLIKVKIMVSVIAKFNTLNLKV